ncbi:Hypothetical protein GSB_13210 [Giardia duodenalis]|uniref:Uncharacterized protein n=2 Tax=Giardia intestinalis TaxID=5741 RepID=C6LZF5_GIAIB|nr:Hypothetical protein GL50581_4186 [Giardia intestinalis ATCC 50581]ESU45011.1 Hypothetical protein GSB_13210 [Giardia intestinalis]
MDDDITLGAYMEGIPLPSGASHYGFCESAAAVYPCTQQLIARLATLLGPGKAGMLKLSLKMDGDDVVATVNCVHEVLKQLQRVQEDNSVLADEISRLQSNNRAKDTRIERTNDAHDKQLRELTFSLQGAKALENELRGTISSLKQELRSLTTSYDDLTRRYKQLEHAKRKVICENEALTDRLRSYLGMGGGVGGLRLGNNDSSDLVNLLCPDNPKQSQQQAQGKQPVDEQSAVTIQNYRNTVRQLDSELRSLHFEVLEDRSIYDKAPLQFDKPELCAKAAKSLASDIRKALRDHSRNRQADSCEQDSSEKIVTSLKAVIQEQKVVIEQLTKAAQRALTGVSAHTQLQEDLAAEKLVLEVQKRNLKSQEQDAERLKAMMQNLVFDLTG